MKDIFKQLLDAQIHWEKRPGPYFQTNFQNKVAILRLNDFPDEVLCTLIVDDEELDLDDTPDYWTLPPVADEKNKN